MGELTGKLAPALAISLIKGILNGHNGGLGAAKLLPIGDKTVGAQLFSVFGKGVG